MVIVVAENDCRYVPFHFFLTASSRSLVHARLGFDQTETDVMSTIGFFIHFLFLVLQKNYIKDQLQYKSP